MLDGWTTVRSGQVRSLQQACERCGDGKADSLLPIDSGKGKGGAGACTALPIGSSACCVDPTSLVLEQSDGWIDDRVRLLHWLASLADRQTHLLTTALILVCVFITNLSAFPSNWVIISYWSRCLRHCVIAVWTGDWSDNKVQRMSKNLGWRSSPLHLARRCPDLIWYLCKLCRCRSFPAGRTSTTSAASTWPQGATPQRYLRTCPSFWIN